MINLSYDSQALRDFCQQHGISKLDLFGSALIDDLRADSDIDLLCTLRPEIRCTLFDWAEMQLELEEIFGRPVDLVSRWAIERSKNPYRRNAILSTAQPIYVEG